MNKFENENEVKKKKGWKKLSLKRNKIDKEKRRFSEED